MKTRVIFGVAGAAFVLLALYVFPPIVATVAMVLLSICAAQEFTAAVAGKGSGPMQLLAMILAAVMAVVSSSLLPNTGFWIRVTVFAALVVLFVFLLRTHKKYGFSDIAAAFVGGIVLPYLLMSLIRILNLESGSVYILLPLLAAWGSDTCALFAGMAFGKHKLAPVVSPKKTVEGSVGGVIGAVVLSMIYAVVIHFVCGYSLSTILLQYTVLGFFGSILGQIGDLSFSVVKRGSGIKDYGKIFPGHGGVLDRFDSVIFVAPAIELLIYAFMMMG
ncbi:MAG: phosphatidate cytidylyltransferase [Eubacteriales bacterium]|nr:phosphatidate cytidylyltransferase [Eubacteriales bacterium]